MNSYLKQAHIKKVEKIGVRFAANYCRISTMF
jgi:hypothetical protein